MPTRYPRALSSALIRNDLAFADLYSIGGRGAHRSGCSSPISRGADAALADRPRRGAPHPDALERKAESELLIASGPHLEDFLAALFGIEAEVRALEARHHELAPAVRGQAPVRAAQGDECVSRPTSPQAFDGAALRRDARGRAGRAVQRARGFRQRRHALGSRTTSRHTPTMLDLALRYAAWAAHTAGGPRCAHAAACCSARRASSICMKLVPLETTHVDGVDAWKLAERSRPRDATASR